MAHRGRQNVDEALALALATGRTLRDAARLTGIAERTAARRWADPSFRTRVSQLRGEMVQRSLGRLADSMVEAADKLRQLLDADHAGVRLAAARSILEWGLKLRECVELEARLADLERRCDEQERSKQ